MQATMQPGNPWSAPAAPRPVGGASKIVIGCAIGLLVLTLAAPIALVLARGHGASATATSANVEPSFAIATDEAGRLAQVATSEGENGTECFNVIGVPDALPVLTGKCMLPPRATQIRIAGAESGVVYGMAGSDVAHVVVTYTNGAQAISEVIDGAAPGARIWITFRGGNAEVASVRGVDANGHAIGRELRDVSHSFL